MKIFGIELSKQPGTPAALPNTVTQIVKVQDQVPEIKVSIPDTRPPALMSFVRSPVLRYHTQRSLGRGAFQPAEYDIAEVGRVEDTDSFVRQAFNKRVALMFKEGWDIGGPNLRTIKYVKARLAQISAATNTPTNDLFRQIGSALVRKSNSFLIKVRKTESSGGRIRSIPGRKGSIQPVAGYFIAPAETMEFELSGNKISRWRQKMPNGDIKHHMVQDVIHIFCDRKEGFVFGTPILVPAMDDIRALRKIEENVEMLIYQHIFPLFQYKVGTKEMPAGITESGEREIDVIRREIQFMPSEGGIVTPERHEIIAIGAEGRALRADSYLEHFKKRVFSGLGVSSVDMGEGSTSNRATADNMSRNLVDSVKDLQQVVEDGVNQFIIKELLLESTFGVDVLDEENLVAIKFKEVDVEAKVKKESHSVDMYLKNAIDHDEMRRVLGKEPILLPTPEETQNEQDTPDNFIQWNRMFFTMFDRPKILMQSIDEPYSLAAQAVTKDNSISIGQQDIDKAGKKQNEQAIALVKEKTKSVTKKINDNLLTSSFKSIKEDTVIRASETGLLDHDWTAQLIRAGLQSTKRRLTADAMIAFRDGFASTGADLQTGSFIKSMGIVRTEIRSRVEHFVTKLSNDIVSGLRRNTDDNMTAPELSNKVRAVFDSMEFRTSFIEDVEIRKAHNLGKLKGLYSKGIKQAFTVLNVNRKTPCATCISRHNKSIETQFSVLDFIPPHHANCDCGISVLQSSKQHDIENSSKELDLMSNPIHESENKRVEPHPSMNHLTTDCPKCGKTATKATNKEMFGCLACGHKFNIDKVLKN